MTGNERNVHIKFNDLCDYPPYQFKHKYSVYVARKFHISAD